MGLFSNYRRRQQFITTDMVDMPLSHVYERHRLTEQYKADEAGIKALKRPQFRLPMKVGECGVEGHILSSRSAVAATPGSTFLDSLSGLTYFAIKQSLHTVRRVHARVLLQVSH